MSDRYAQLVNAPLASQIARRVGLPRPVPLERHQPGDPVIRGRVLLGAAPGGRLAEAVAAVLAGAARRGRHEPEEPLRSAVAEAGLDATRVQPRRARRAALQGARARRDRDRRLHRAGRAAGLLPPDGLAGSSAAGA